jgi:hypothetical protein
MIDIVWGVIGSLWLEAFFSLCNLLVNDTPQTSRQFEPLLDRKSDTCRGWGHSFVHTVSILNEKVANVDQNLAIGYMNRDVRFKNTLIAVLPQTVEPARTFVTSARHYNKKLTCVPFIYRPGPF